MKIMKKQVLCTATAVMLLLSTTATATAKPRWLEKYRVTFDNELGVVGNVTLRFATESGGFIKPITKTYGSKISLTEYVPTREGYTFAGWFTDPRTKQNRVLEFTFIQNDVVYAKWNKISNDTAINEILQKDQCYLTDEEETMRTEYITEHNKKYIDGFGYMSPSKTQTIIADSDGNIEKQVGKMN